MWHVLLVDLFGFGYRKGFPAELMCVRQARGARAWNKGGMSCPGALLRARCMGARERVVRIYVSCRYSVCWVRRKDGRGDPENPSRASRTRERDWEGPLGDSLSHLGREDGSLLGSCWVEMEQITQGRVTLRSWHWQDTVVMCDSVVRGNQWGASLKNRLRCLVCITWSRRSGQYKKSSIQKKCRELRLDMVS